MPPGWIHGRFGEIATVRMRQTFEASENEVEQMLVKLFAGDVENFAAWVGEHTKLMVQAYDSEVQAGDLETVSGFIQTKARRPLNPLNSDRKIADKRAEAFLPFEIADWNQP